MLDLHDAAGRGWWVGQAFHVDVVSGHGGGARGDGDRVLAGRRAVERGGGRRVGGRATFSSVLSIIK